MSKDEQEFDWQEEYDRGKRDHEQLHGRSVIEMILEVPTGCFHKPPSGSSDAYVQGWESAST